MAVKKYVDALTATKEESTKALAPARAAEQQAHIGLTVKQLEINIMSAQNDLAAMCGQYPLPVDAIVEAQDELDLSTRRLTQLTQLSKELFGA